jgi:hypothetical protein
VAGFDLHVIEEPLTSYRVARTGVNMSSTSWHTRSRETYEYAQLLRDLWNLRSIAELREMFPGEVPAGSEDDRLLLYHLAHIARARRTVHHEQFAADTLFELARRPEAVALAAERFGFSHRDYRDFIASNPLGRATERSAWRRFKFFVASRVPARGLRAFLRCKARLMRRHHPRP